MKLTLIIDDKPVTFNSMDNENAQPSVDTDTSTGAQVAAPQEEATTSESATVPEPVPEILAGDVANG